MVLTIAVGIGATMTTLGLYFVLSGDPIPHKSGQLYYAQLEPRTLGKDATLDKDPPRQMSRYDAEELLRQKRADRQAVMSAGAVTVQPAGSAAQPFRLLRDVRRAAAQRQCLERGR
jgi:putative ABC transport system permease protein